MLRILGIFVLLAGGLTLLMLTFADRFNETSPALADWEQSAHLRRYAWLAAGAIYLAGGLMLAFLRRWAVVLFIVGAVIAAACMAYDMAAFAQSAPNALGSVRIRYDIISLVLALLLTALTVPLVARRVLR